MGYGYFVNVNWGSSQSSKILENIFGSSLFLEGRQNDLVVLWNIFPYIENVIIPIDFHILQMGRVQTQTRDGFEPRGLFG